MRILWIPHTGWHIAQRAHLFCRALAERHEVHVTDWVADFAAPRDYLSMRYLRNFTYRHYSDSGISVHGIPRLSPALFSPVLRQINTRIFEYSVSRIIAQRNIDVVVGTFVVPPPQIPRLVFDLFDENVASWRAAGRRSSYAAEIEQVERAYIRRADAVVAASSVLADKARDLGPRGPIYCIPNGVHIRQFDHADGTALRRQLGLAGPIVGMVGNHTIRAEIDKVLDAARTLRSQGVTILIAGQGSAMAYAAARIQREAIDNVRLHGYVAPSQMPDFLAMLDVGICPYAKTAMDDARSPMRLFAYAATGLPIVCTQLVEVQRLGFSSVILVDDSPQSFADGVARALTLPRSRPAQLERYDIAQITHEYERVLAG